jgi:hypothetical protein
MSGEHAAKPVIAGATTFAATETLCLRILRFLVIGAERPADKPHPHR